MYRFGDFEVVPAERELRCAGRAVHLEPQAFDLLVHLVQHRDRVVEKIELLDAVWGHRFVSDAGLTTRIKEVRRAVGDDGSRQHTVKNVRGRGYRFVAPVRSGQSSARERPVHDHLVGRTDDVAAVLDALGRSSIVTLIGPGGVGKSALARFVVERTVDEGGGGAHWIELAAVDADAPVLPVVARMLDIEVDPERPGAAIRSLARLDALVVLDNCEHVVDEVAGLISALVSVTGPNVRLLATSRVALGLPGEEVIPVGPLLIDPAIELFVLRAQAASPTWDPTTVLVETMTELVTALDRLPLTIEMAAARARSMSFDELADNVAAGTPMLQVSHRTPARRHRSLESLVRGSAELLDDRQRSLFEGFSVFAGGVSVADAAAVLSPDDGDGVIFEFAALAERSLLVVDTSGPSSRYSMLVTMRSVARRWLADSGHAAALRRRHAEYFAEVLAQIDGDLRGAGEADARTRLDGLVDEVRVAHAWAREHDPILAAAMSGALFQYAYHRLWHEPAAWSAELLRNRTDDDFTGLEGAVLMVAGAAAHAGELASARELARRVLTSPDVRLRTIALELIADVALYEGDLDVARDAARELRRLGTEHGDRHALAFGAVDAALARTYAGDTAGALEELAGFDARDFAVTDRAWLAQARGDALSMAGADGAVAAFGEALGLGHEVGNRFIVSVALTSLAAEHARAGDARLALATYDRALAEFMRHGNPTHAVTAMRNLVSLLADLGDVGGAVILAGALSDPQLRVSYGAEAERIRDVLRDAEARVGSDDFRAWFEEGRALDVDAAMRTAAARVAALAG